MPQDGDLLEHTVAELLRQRVVGLALGYEDLNDHDELSRDRLLATVVGKPDPTGQARRQRQNRDRPLAGKSTLNRLELTTPDASAASRYKKIVLDFEAELAEARAEYARTGQAARRFKDFSYRTLDSWSRARRVIGKAEHLAQGANPRFVVTSLGAKAWPARALYEDRYCQRGEMENRIKEQQLCLFADRTSTHQRRSNQVRLWLSSLAYVLVSGLRRLGLSGTAMARSRCDTIRHRLLKVGAAVRVSVRRVWVSLASGYPWRELFRAILGRLDAAIAGRIFRPLRC